MIRCFTKTRRESAVVLLSAAALFVFGCGSAKILAGDAIKHAEMLGDKAKQAGATDDMLLSYRLHYRAAQNAMEKKRYKTALQEAQTAGGEAGDIVKKREGLGADARERLDALWHIAERDPFPRKILIEACFNAQKLIENNDFEKALVLISDTERDLRLELRIKERSSVIIQADDEYYKQYKFIAVYEKVGINGLEGEIVERFYKPVEATFVESKWVAVDRRYVKISFTTAPEAPVLSGWVEGKFVF